MGWNDYCQLSGQTKKERFPKIFDRLLELKPDAKRILSFGCSSGEECFSLEGRFPEAEIIGLDINYSSVTRARINNKFKDKIYFHTEIGGTGKYDIITALMVLFGLETPVTEKNWIASIRKMHKHLNINGILVIYTSEYNFDECELAGSYQIISSWERIHSRNSKVYYCGYYRKIKE